MVGAVQEGSFKRCVHGCKWCLYERECCGPWGGPLVLRESLLGGDVYGVCHCQLLWLCLRDFFSSASSWTRCGECAGCAVCSEAARLCSAAVYMRYAAASAAAILHLFIVCDKPTRLATTVHVGCVSRQHALVAPLLAWNCWAWYLRQCCVCALTHIQPVLRSSCVPRWAHGN